MAEYISRDDAEKALLERCKETGYGGLTPDDIRLVMRTPWRSGISGFHAVSGCQRLGNMCCVFAERILFVFCEETKTVIGMKKIQHTFI